MPAVAVLTRRVEERARRDPDFADLLDTLLDAPTAPRERLERIAARTLNHERRTALARDFVTGSIPTREVQTLLRHDTPQAVHQLRRRGKLLGAAVGNRTWFPAWQFDGDRLRPDLPKILELLARFTSDPMAADRVMRIKRDDLDGASISEALRRKATEELAWRTLTAVGA